MKKIIIGLLMLLPAVAKVQAMSPFDERWIGTRFILGNIYTTDQDEFNFSDKMCLGQAEWHVSGHINGLSFDEVWTVAPTGSDLPNLNSFYLAGTLLANNGIPANGLNTYYSFTDSYINTPNDDAYNFCKNTSDNGDFLSTANVVFQPTGLYGVEVTRYDPEGTDNGLDLGFTALRAMPKEWSIKGKIDDEVIPPNE